jgi:hypothetical protein
LRDPLIAAWKLVSHEKTPVDALRLFTRCGEMPWITVKKS